MAFFVRAGQPVDIQKALTAAKMVEACGYRQHADSINAIKPPNSKTTQMSDISNTVNMSQDAAIKNLQQEVSMLRDLVEAKIINST